MIRDLSGQKFGQYELRERLGRGGMAEVYKAYQASMDRFVAVKVMLGHLAEDEQFVERFKREAQAVGKLRHGNIVQVFDFGVEQDVYYMVMEYIQGKNLKSYIQQEGALSLGAALKLSSQLTDALDYAHKAGMVHRDVKPANIMFMDNSYKHLVLTDFGIARIVGQSGLTASGAFVGTPAYISPEAARGESVDERSDLYSAGIILYEMLTGRVPYDADTPVGVIMKHINAPLPTRKDYGRDVPDSIERIVLKSLSKDPAQRYLTADEMKTALDGAFQGLNNNILETKPAQATPVQNRMMPAEAPTFIASQENTQDTLSKTEATLGKPAPKATLATQKLPADKGKLPNSPEKQNRLKLPQIALIASAIVALLVVGVFLATNDDSGNASPTDGGSVAIVDPTIEPVDQPDAVEAVPTEEPPPGMATVGEPAGEVDAEAAPAASDPDESASEAPPAADIDSAVDTETASDSSSVDVEAPPASGAGAMISSTQVATALIADPAVELSPVITESEKLLWSDQPEAATTYLTALLDENPKDVEALAAFALLHSELTEETALTYADDAIAADPDSVLGYIAKSDAFLIWQENDYAGSLASIQEAETINPDHPEVLWRLARGYWFNSEPEKAEAYFEKAVASGASGPRFARFASDFYYNQLKDYEKALPYAAQLYDLQPQDGSNIFYYLGSLIQMGQPEKALEVFTTDGTLDDEREFSVAAYLAYRAGEYDQAKEFAKTAVALSAEAWDSLYVLGLLSWYEDKDLNAAVQYLEQVQAADTFWGYPFLNADFGHDPFLDEAAIYLDAGETDQAIGVYTEIIDSGEWNPVPYIARGDLYLEQGKKELARADYQSALDRSDTPEETQLALSKITALGPAPSQTPE